MVQNTSKKISNFLKKLRLKNKLSLRQMGFTSSSTPYDNEDKVDTQHIIRNIQQYAIVTQTGINLEISPKGKISIKAIK